MSRLDLSKCGRPRQSRTFAMPSLPAQMTAIAIRAPGAADMLVPEQRPLPRPTNGEVLSPTTEGAGRREPVNGNPYNGNNTAHHVISRVDGLSQDAPDNHVWVA